MDQIQNFIKGTVVGGHDDVAVTISVADASNYPNPASGEYNVIFYDATNYPDPADDPNVEIVRVTGRDTGANTLTVTRAQEGTTASTKNTANATYKLILALTKKTIDDLIAQMAIVALGGGTLTGAMDLGENAGLVLDAALSADGKYSGIIEGGLAGAALSFGQLCYFNNDDSRWELADANLSDGYDKKLGICVLAANADGDATKMLLWGKVRADAAFPALTIGAPAYMGETAGAIVTAQPTTADAAIRVIGTANTADELFFNPSNDYITHA